MHIGETLFFEQRMMLYICLVRMHGRTLGWGSSPSRFGLSESWRGCVGLDLPVYVYILVKFWDHVADSVTLGYWVISSSIIWGFIGQQRPRTRYFKGGNRLFGNAALEFAPPLLNVDRS